MLCVFKQFHKQIAKCALCGSGTRTERHTAFCTGTTADLETGQTSELASFADGTPLASGNAPDHGSKSELKGSRQNGSAIPEPHARLQNLQRLCAELHSDSEITGSVRDACAALQSRIDAEIR